MDFKIYKLLCLLLWTSYLVSCTNSKNSNFVKVEKSPELYIHLLGIAQDAGYPQANCQKSCCTDIWNQKEKHRYVTSLGIIDKKSGQQWIIDATPDFKYQLEMIKQTSSIDYLAGIFLTHAHVGHYTGLIHLGREVMGADATSVYAMPKMSSFLSSNGPWDQLVKLNNISLQTLQADSTVILSDDISIIPIIVPHRDEYSETVGYKIISPDKKVLFIPDIDKWDKWNRSIIEELANVDIALLDGTFFKNGEIAGRDMSEIPHPFVEESMSLFKELSKDEKNKIHFIHFNHTNPLLRENSAEKKSLTASGFPFLDEGSIIPLE